MRRLLLILAAVATALAAATDVAVARDHREQGRAEGGRGEGRAEGRGGAPGWGGGAPPWVRGPGRAAPAPWAGGRPEGRWERRAPPEAYGPPPGYYQPRRGGYLPPEARAGVVQDYGRYRLRPPPRGYAWVRSGHALMLMDMGTGQVFDVIPD